MYRIDLHVHTSEVSSCGKVSAAEVVALYKQRGYQGIVITDHFYQGLFDRLGSMSLEKKIESFLTGYRKAALVGKEIGLDVFLGIELRFTSNTNDYLVYGVTEEFLQRNPLIYQLELAEFREMIHGTGMLTFQAHPFRSGVKVADPGLLDGVEVFNGNQRHNSQNALAYQFALQNKLPMISGSDFHEVEDLGQGGIVVRRPIVTQSDLCQMVLGKERVETIGVATVTNIKVV